MIWVSSNYRQQNPFPIKNNSEQSENLLSENKFTNSVGNLINRWEKVVLKEWEKYLPHEIIELIGNDGKSLENECTITM